MSTHSRMYNEARSSSKVAAIQISENKALVKKIGNTLRIRRPQLVVTCARGSSDHAATYGKYLIETFAGISTASFAPSVSSVYAARQEMNGASYIAPSFLSYKLTRLGISNFLSTDSHMTTMAVNTIGPDGLLLLFSSSGSVRDSIELAKLARDTSLSAVAITNRFKSPLGEVCDRQIVAVGSESPLSSGSLESKCGQLLVVELLFDAICRISDVHAKRIREAADAVVNKQF